MFFTHHAANDNTQRQEQPMVSTKRWSTQGWWRMLKTASSMFSQWLRMTINAMPKDYAAWLRRMAETWISSSWYFASTKLGAETTWKDLVVQSLPPVPWEKLGITMDQEIQHIIRDMSIDSISVLTGHTLIQFAGELLKLPMQFSTKNTEISLRPRISISAWSLPYCCSMLFNLFTCLFHWYCAIVCVSEKIKSTITSFRACPVKLNFLASGFDQITKTFIHNAGNSTTRTTSDLRLIATFTPHLIKHTKILLYCSMKYTGNVCQSITEMSTNAKRHYHQPPHHY